MARGLLGAQGGEGLLGRPPQPRTHQPSVLDRILGLYGQDPATHIPNPQTRKHILGEGLMNAGIAIGAAGGRGHDSLTPGQVVAQGLNAMRQTGPAYAQKQRMLEQRARIQQAIQDGSLGPQQMQAVMMELIAAGDYEGARAISEVLKSRQGQRPIRMDEDTLYDPINQKWLQDPNAIPNADIQGWRSGLAHPEGQPGTFEVPYDSQGNLLWDRAAKEGSTASRMTPSQRWNMERGARTDYLKRLGKNMEESLRLVDVGIRAGGRAIGGDGVAQVGLLYSFVKALDPNSVVREGEVRLAQEAASLWQSMRGMYDKWLAGEAVAIPSGVARQMVAYLKRLQDNNIDFANRVRQDTVDNILSRYGLPAEALPDVTQGYSTYSVDAAYNMARGEQASGEYMPLGGTAQPPRSDTEILDEVF